MLHVLPFQHKLRLIFSFPKTHVNHDINIIYNTETKKTPWSPCPKVIASNVSKFRIDS
jgi:hypothetical protein